MRHQRKFIPLATITVAAWLMVGCSSSADESTKTADSEPCGNSTVGALQVLTFCGEGSITVGAGTTNLDLDKAECELRDDYVVVNAGTFVLAPGAVGENEAQQLRAARSFASVTIGRYEQGSSSKPATTDGTYTAVVAYNDEAPEPTRTVEAKATLREGRTAGDFTGSLADGTRVTGSFTC